MLGTRTEVSSASGLKGQLSLPQWNLPQSIEEQILSKVRIRELKGGQEQGRAGTRESAALQPRTTDAPRSAGMLPQDSAERCEVETVAISRHFGGIPYIKGCVCLTRKYS